MRTINDGWEEFSRWLETQKHDEEPLEDDGWICHPDEWQGEQPEPPPNFEGGYFAAI